MMGNCSCFVVVRLTFFLAFSKSSFRNTFIRVSSSLDPDQDRPSASPGLEVIKLKFILKLKITRNDWLFADKQPIIALYFEFKTVLKFYNLEA